LGSRVDQIDTGRNLVGYPAILYILGRLRTHQAIVIARSQQRKAITLARRKEWRDE